MKEIYLGDGLYAGFDGISIRLRAPRENGDHEVFIERGQMWDDLVAFAKEVFE
jgi:hypothetical protein